MTFDPTGSLWRRWDPHVHAPGTILNEQFGGRGSFDEYIDRLETADPALEGIGITDYLLTDCYEQVREAKATGRLPNVGTLFPNVEMRLSIPTTKDKGINIHLLVSPDDPEHVEQLHRFLTRLYFAYGKDKFHCTRPDLIRLGRAHDSSLTDEVAALKSGVNQFKVEFNQLQEEFGQSRWMQEHCLVAVAGGSTDGTSGLRSTDKSFDALRKEIERFAHVIFTSSEKASQFWRGDGVASIEELQQTYGGRRPCLHGSDAHCLDDVGKPDLDRLTWIKGDPMFETLRQACLEPSRVYIGELPPELQSPERTICGVQTTGADWLLADQVPINPGLVAIIGARGSGKTALADLIALGGGNGSPLSSTDSFLHRAGQFLGGVGVELAWTDGEPQLRDVRTHPDEVESSVHYLSQQFVDRLCSAEGASDELIEEVQRVVFGAHEPALRMEATSFEELLDARVGDTRRQREHIRTQMDRISADALTERIRKTELPAKRKAMEAIEARLNNDRKARDAIVNRGEQQRAEYYERLNTAIDARERTLQSVGRRQQRLAHLEAEIDRHVVSVLPDVSQQLLAAFPDLNLTPAEAAAFTVMFDGDPSAIVKSRRAAAQKESVGLEAGDPSVLVTISTSPADLGRAPLGVLRTEFKKVEADIGVDKQNAQRLKSLNQKVAAGEIELGKALQEVELFEGADERMKSLRATRASRYQDYFDLVVQEQAVLQELYAPLQQKLAQADSSAHSLRLVVVRRVDVDAWAARGEDLLDLRKTGTFKGRGALANVAREKLVPAWESGSAADVADAMAEFRTKFDNAIQQQASVDSEEDPAGYHRWTLDVGRWLYSMDHIDVQYSFEYENLPLSQLSPGTRGIVLLLLYLALDQEDARPLIIDQPEENLDPRSVFAELVELFKLARLRRQVIIVTHNANLVVNTDVDQVIVARCTRQGEGKPPKMAYLSGSLENPAIRGEVCEILEGGEAAFRERAKRLRVRSL